MIAPVQHQFELYVCLSSVSFYWNEYGMTSRHNFPLCSLIWRLPIHGTYNPVTLDSNVWDNDVIWFKETVEWRHNLYGTCF